MIDNCLELLLAYYKDKVQDDMLIRASCEYQRLLESDAGLRRKKKEGLIVDMAALRVELVQFSFTYSQLKKRAGAIPAIDRQIMLLRRKIRMFSNMKNRHT